MIDLRSDTVTKPSPEMLEAMMSAAVGDDVYGEDPSVNALEQLAADMTGKEAGLFAASGTQSNLLSLLSHCERGQEYIAGTHAHTYLYEAGGAAVLGGIQPCTLPFNERGELPLEQIEAAIKPDDYHFAVTKLVCLENTQAGKVLTPQYLRDFSQLAQQHGLRSHLDGARVFNAAVALNVPLADICCHFDSVSLCLSKGLGCPVGSVLVGDSKTLQRARRWRKMLGGGMRQAGYLAAAGIHALVHQVDRLCDDHQHAHEVAAALAELPGFGVAEPPQTNMVMLAESVDLGWLTPALAEAEIRISGRRWVFHHDVNRDDVDRLLSTCKLLSADYPG